MAVIFQYDLSATASATALMALRGQMIPRTLVRDLRAHIGQQVTVYGWVNTLRLQRKMQFVLVRDHTDMVQIAHQRPDGGSALEQLIEHEMPIESAIKVTGTVVDNAIVKLGGLEIIPESIEMTNRADSPLPINDQTGIDQRLDWRFLDLRVPSRRLIFEVQTTVEKALRDFAYAQGCTQLHTPKLMGTASESGAEVFSVKYFDRTAYLAQSPQFYKQMAIASGIDKVFEIGPVFRAEPSDKGLSLDALRSYLDCFRFGMPPHGGLGAGLNRIMMVLLGLDSIREFDLPVPRAAPARTLDVGRPRRGGYGQAPCVRSRSPSTATRRYCAWPRCPIPKRVPARC